MSHDHHHDAQPDFGTGQKKLSIYLTGMVSCIVLTIVAFWAVMSHQFSNTKMIVIIYAAAIVQFFIQVICFLRLNMKTSQGQVNVVAFAFTGLILLCIIIGSVWIMHNVQYFMMS